MDPITKKMNRTRILTQVKTETKPKVNAKITLESPQALHYKDIQTKDDDDFRPSLVLDENDQSEDEFLAQIDAKSRAA